MDTQASKDRKKKDAESDKPQTPLERSLQPHKVVTKDGKKEEVGPADGGVEPDRFVEELNEDLDPT